MICPTGSESRIWSFAYDNLLDVDSASRSHNESPSYRRFPANGYFEHVRSLLAVFQRVKCRLFRRRGLSSRC